MTRQRVLAIGLDALSPQLLRKLIVEGRLPTLARLLNEGVSGSIRGLDGFFIGSTWPSLYTGGTPAEHGFYYQLQIEPGTYELRRTESGPVTAIPPFWRLMSEAGRRVAICDVPLSSVESQLNGMQIVEWGVHDRLFGLQTLPINLRDDLVATYGSHPVGSFCDAGARSVEQYQSLVEQLELGIETKARMTCDLLRRERWDFLMQVFSESHCVGHQCWHLHDSAHPAHDASLSNAMGDPVERIYRALDGAISEIVEEAGDSRIVVFAAHGMTTWYGVQFMFRDILYKLGAAVPAVSEQQSDGSSRLRLIWHRLPTSARSLMKPLRELLPGSDSNLATGLGLGVDTSVSACLPLSSGLGTAGIRFNLAGREPTGVLRPGPELESYVDWLTRSLRDLVDSKSGRPLVGRVLRTSSIYSGPLLDSLPDLIIEWSRDFPVGSTLVGRGKGAVVTARSIQTGKITGRNQYGRTGEHSPEGFFTINGRGILPRVLEKGASILDLAPTFCRMVGIDSSRYQGKPIDFQ